MKTRSERTTALMLGGVSEGSLDYLEPTKRKSTKLGISLMRWILVSMTSRNLTRAWRTWVEYVIPLSCRDTDQMPALLVGIPFS